MISEQHQPCAVLCSAWEPLYPGKVIVDAKAWGSKDCFLVLYIPITATNSLAAGQGLHSIDWLESKSPHATI